jgi:predicted AAA+ superfamily ATPase
MINDAGGDVYTRILEPTLANAKKSILLLGPRQVGKSTLLRTTHPESLTFNLLDASVFRQISTDPTSIRRTVLAQRRQEKVVVIDEIQRIPELMNEVQLMIEEHKIRFILTGSSARALKRKGVNLLGGRARLHLMNPLTSGEIGESFDILRAINHGLLPAIYDSDTPNEDLQDYCGVYLREEVAAEGLARNIPGFSRFLDVAAKSSGMMINYTNIASDAQVKRTTVVDYFQILRDTLLGFDLEPWTKSKKRKAISTSKFYFFDPGVQKHLAGIDAISAKSPLFGLGFEHLIFRELKSGLDYGIAKSLHYWRSTSNIEIDFLLDESIAIECKTSSTIRRDDLKGLLAIGEENKGIKKILVSFVERPQLIQDIHVLPWRDFLELFWAKDLNHL